MANSFLHSHGNPSQNADFWRLRIARETGGRTSNLFPERNHRDQIHQCQLASSGSSSEAWHSKPRTVYGTPAFADSLLRTRRGRYSGADPLDVVPSDMSETLRTSDQHLTRPGMETPTFTTSNPPQYQVPGYAGLLRPEIACASQAW